ncbi:cryptochrome/photolyase family protein [Massilia sp. B-10]|nr:cryptochrome/photolyase family protein [Massilia sp. B-10]
MRAAGATAFEYQAPDEWRLDQQLAAYADALPCPARMCDSEHFLTTHDEAQRIFMAASSG